MYRAELSKRAQRDLRRMDRRTRSRLLDLLEKRIGAHPPPQNLDVKPLAGRAPWLRLRSGDYRVLYRPLSASELRALGEKAERGFLVERVVNRRDLRRAAATLPH